MMAESARTKKEHESAMTYHKDHEETAKSESRPNAAVLHHQAFLLHREAAQYGTEALVNGTAVGIAWSAI